MTGESLEEARLSKTEINGVLEYAEDLRKAFVDMTVNARENMQAVKGEEEESGNKYQLKEGEYVNVVDLSDNKELAERIAGSGKSRITVIRDYLFEMLGGEEITMSDGIKAVVDKSDVKHIANRARSGRQTAEVSGIKDIIKNAKFYNKVETDHKKYTAFRYYETPVKYGNDILFVTVNLGYGNADKEYHIYDLTEPKERNTASRINGSGRPIGIALRNGVPADSIAQGTPASQELSRKNQLRSDGNIPSDIDLLIEASEDIKTGRFTIYFRQPNLSQV